MAITGGFGTTFDFVRGTMRRWVMARDGIKRWADSSEPVDAQEPQIIGQPCPWCKGNMEYHHPGLWHYAVCRKPEHECGYATQAATSAGLRRAIDAARRPNTGTKPPCTDENLQSETGTDPQGRLE